MDKKFEFEVSQIIPNWTDPTITDPYSIAHFIFGSDAQKFIDCMREAFPTIEFKLGRNCE